MNSDGFFKAFPLNREIVSIYNSHKDVNYLSGSVILKNSSTIIIYISFGSLAQF